MEIKNALITSTMLGLEDHSIMSCMLHMDYGGSGQGFGGYALDVYCPTAKKRVGHAACGEFIKRILDVLEVSSWEKIPKTYCRVKSTRFQIHAIGHITKDKWFNPEEDIFNE